MRRKFIINNNIAAARLYITAHGIYQAKINGHPVADTLLAPEYTDYNKQLKYQIYDIGHLLQRGGNGVGVTVADGWYKGTVSTGLGNDYGDNPALLLQLEITYDDGCAEMICSDEHFVYSYDGPYRYADLFKGEKYDATRENGDYSLYDYDDANWKPVHIVHHPLGRLIAQSNPPVKKMKAIPAADMFITPKGEWVADFGQNISGFIRAEMNLEKGEEVSFEHGEVLDKNGNFHYVFSGTDKEQKDVYIGKGNGTEIYQPVFTYHGFRYVKITGGINWTKEKIQAIPITSENRMTGYFECADPQLNRLQNNILWSQLGNMIAIPTDCPTREKAGWTGDVLVYGKTALFNQDLFAFFNSWLAQIRAEQAADGRVMNTVPMVRSYINEHHMGSVGWGDVIVTLPWDLYQVYGDKQILTENYNAMNRWMGYLENLSGQSYIINKGFHYGDWLVPSITEEQGFAAAASLTRDYTCTALYAYTTGLMKKIAAVVGDMAKSKEYEERHRRIREAFWNTFHIKDGRLKNHTQGSYILAVRMDLAPEEMKPLLLKHLETLIQENGNRLDTGFMSVPFILDVLTENGYKKLAYTLLFQNKNPSWLYEVAQGATTLWEQWGAVKPDGAVSGCSFNHYAFGCVGDWIYRNVLGLCNIGGTYENILINPGFDSGLAYAKGRYDSIHGVIEIHWSAEGENKKLTVTIPTNVKAVILWKEKKYEVGSGTHEYH
jgi:alpha-L-rhamnosidase